MADIYMHSRMAEDVIAIQQKEVDKNIVFLGAQSSDPMYYANFHKNAKQYRYFADRMHDTDTQKLMIHLTEYVKNHNNKATYSFLFGFICHYALDVKIHPYVYHNVGVYDINRPETHPYRGLHLKFERSIDALLYEQEQHKKARTMKLTKTYFPIKKVEQPILDMMQSSFKNQFGVDNGDEIYKTCVLHMYNIIRFITADRFGIKKQIYKILDHFEHEQDLFMADLSFFNHIEQYDFHNLKHHTWYHPQTNEPSTQSVPEIYQEAIQFAVSLLNQVDAYLAGDKIDLKMVFTNLSFNSGRDCTLEKPFQHFHIYRPKNNL